MTIKQIEIIDKNKFVKATLDKNVEVFIVQRTFLIIIAIYPAKKTWIALLITKEIKISIKYSDFSDIFLKKKALVLSEATNLNQHAIKF